MNYLAHLILSGERPGLQVGAVLGDFARDLETERLSAELREGVVLHRRIDAFADAHPAHRATRARLRPAFGHYAGVVADVFFDHALSLDWERWSNEPLARYAERVYARLSERHDELSPSLQRALPRMVEHDLLTSYGTVDGVALALDRMARRTRHGTCLRDAGAALSGHADAVREDFRTLFPDLREFVTGRDR